MRRPLSERNRAAAINAPKAAKPDKPVAEEASSAAVGQDGLTGQTVVDPSKGPAINESDEVGRKLMALYPDMKLVSVDPVPGLPLAHQLRG